jgi:molecular chaperone GrpE (heat shock protein)
MTDPIRPKLAKLPFFAGDALLLISAGLIFTRSQAPVGLWATALIVFCVAGAAGLGVAPFLLEYHALVRLCEAESLATVVSQVQKLEDLAAQVRGATGQWQTAQEQADKTVAAAKGLAERMSTEAKGFSEFIQRVNDSEKANLRLEVEKMQRGETEWLQVLVHVLDHIYALHQGALRSRQPGLIEQMTQFQNACRDVARRVGLAPFTANPEDRFDPHRHQWVEGKATPPEGATVGQTLATGYTFQGRLLRPVLVNLRNGAAPAPIPAPDTVPAEAGPQQKQLAAQPENEEPSV